MTLREYQRAWREKNRKHLREYRHTHREKINAQYRAAYKKNPRILARVNAGYDIAGAQEKHLADPRRRILTMAKHRAKKKGLAFNLKIEDVVIPEFCPVLGIKLSVRDRRPGDSSPSLDRVNPKLGYVRGNVAVISLRANRIKYDATWEELQKVAFWLCTFDTKGH